MKKYIFAVVLLLSGLFVATAQAQHGHGGHGGGHGHGGHGYGGHSLGHSLGHILGGSYGHSYYPHGHYYYSPLYDYAPAYCYAYPPTTYVYPRTTSAYPPTSLPAAQEALAANQAKIQVVLPDPEAQVLFDGSKTSRLAVSACSTRRPLNPAAPAPARSPHPGIKAALRCRTCAS